MDLYQHSQGIRPGANQLRGRAGLMGESVLGLGKVPRGWGGGVVSVSELVEVGSHVRGCVSVGGT